MIPTENNTERVWLHTNLCFIIIMTTNLKLSIFVLAMFYAYILVIAFNKELLATKLGDGVMTVAFPIGAAIIVISFITTLIYVRRANGEFEDLTNQIKEDVKDAI